MGSISNRVFSEGTAGLAFVGAACSSFRYSINEDHFQTNSFGIAAHEIGHKYETKIFSFNNMLKKFVITLLF